MFCEGVVKYERILSAPVAEALKLGECSILLLPVSCALAPSRAA